MSFESKSVYKQDKVERGLDLFAGMLIFACLALTPAVVSKSSYDSFILPKIFWLKSIISLLIGISLIRIINSFEFRIYLNKINLAIVLYFLAHLISLLNAKSLSLAGDRISLLFYFAAFAFIFQDFLSRNNRWFMLLGIGIVIIGSFISVMAVRQDFIAAFMLGRVDVVSKLEDWRGYITSGFGNTSHIGDFLAISFMIGVVLMLFVRGAKRFAFFIILLALIFPSLIICWSVTSNFALIIGIIILLCFIFKDSNERRMFRRRKIRVAAFLSICFAVSMFYILPNRANPHNPGIFKQAFSSQRWKDGGPTRLAIWHTTIEMIKRNPIIGVGAGNFTYIYPQILAPSVMNNPELKIYAGSYTNAAHNEFLQILAETGIIGLIPFIMMFYFFFWLILKKMEHYSITHIRQNAMLFILMCMFIIMSLMNFTMQLPYSALLFFTLLSAPVALKNKRDRDSILIPVEFNYGTFRITAYMVNMEYPGEIGLSLEGSKLFRVAASSAAAALIFAAMISPYKDFKSDIWYKQAKIYRDAGSFREAEISYKEALRLNPKHSDCRSAYSDFLLMQGRFREALDEVSIVQKRLMSNELYLRIGQCYEGLGSEKKAYDNYVKFFESYPFNKEMYADQYQMVLKKSKENDKDGK